MNISGKGKTPLFQIYSVSLGGWPAQLSPFSFKFLGNIPISILSMGVPYAPIEFHSQPPGG